MIRAIISTGIGRLHLVQTAVAVKRAGVAVRLITGWVPSPRWRGLANMIGRLVGRPNLYERLATRRGGGALENAELRSCALGEVLAVLTLRLVPRPWLAWWPRWDWLSFGRASRRHLRDADVFHVRSGAGQGGAITRAREQGMSVVVDQSAGHPAFMERQLRDEFARYGLPFRLGPSDPLWRLVLQDCADADVLLVNSAHVRDTFVAEGYPPERIAVIYLGVREDFLRLKNDYACPGPLRLLFTGNFGVLKGAHYLLPALQRLDEAGVDYCLTVVGTNAEAPRLLREFPVRGEVRLVGHVLQDRLKGYLTDSDIYVFPSLSEGCASACMEALAAGLPVVTTRESGVPVTDGRDGLLVPAKDATALAAGIMRLAGDEALRAELGRAGARLIAEGYTWDEYGRQLAALYGRLRSGSGNGEKPEGKEVG